MAAMADEAAHAPGRPLRFSKMHGAGNDFVVLDLRGGPPPPDAAQCRALADRHTGVGCDQILTVEDPARRRRARALPHLERRRLAVAAVRQRRALHRRVAGARWRRVGGDEFALDSPVGRHAVTRLGADRYRIVMGVPQFDPARIPLHGFAGAQDQYVLDMRDNVLGFGAVSMGNPHAVIEVDDVDAAPVETIGPLLQASDAFPQSANVGFAQVQSRDRVRLRVYERGAGETLACGSGACAAAAVLMRRGRVDRDVTIAMPGGELQVSWPADDAPLSMAGPAAFVFEGEWKQ